MKIMIVDDSKLALMDLEAALINAGHEVVSAAGGREALLLLEDCDCHIVITDWEMPIMSGLQLCRAIRGESMSGYVYLIVVSAHDTQEERVQALCAGADDFIAKPFYPAELVARVGVAERILSLETRDVAIFAMAKLAERRDPETGAHLERVRRYSRLLAEQLARTTRFREKVDAEYVRLIYMTSPLHDIGKVGIADAVLLKPGKLTNEEFEVMKTHAAIGAETLNSALQAFPGAKFFQMARDIAATHHERFDGSGYPARLAGEEIPLCGRIVAVADVYDALTSARVYKAAFSHQRAVEIILAESGAHFDPDVVAAFTASERAFLAIHDRYAEPRALAA